MKQFPQRDKQPRGSLSGTQSLSGQRQWAQIPPVGGEHSPGECEHICREDEHSPVLRV